MNILEIIAKKRDKKELNKEEINYFIKNYTEGNIPDYQASALIMAIYLNGMSEEEIVNLTFAMVSSGEVLDLSHLGKVIVDKHSTGGVGDKVSLIVLPLVASLGIPVVKMSGRGLGFTGGTADKLESIPGFKTKIDIDEFIDNVKKVGISMITQTQNIAPADKKIYALRDVIACVESIPLIASSIMSKKIASGADKIVIDVTVGSGAFMKNIESARALSNEMIKIGKMANRETVCILTNMDEPLGYSIGNTLEVIEAIKFLKGEIIDDLKQVVLEIGSYMLKFSGFGDDIEENKLKLLENLENGKAYNKFLELVKNQGGDTSYIEDISKFKKAKYVEKIISNKDGFITEMNAKNIGEITCYLGAGRIRKEDDIELETGIVLNKKVGDKVNVGDVIANIYANDIEKIKKAKNDILDIFKIEKNEPKRKQIIKEIIC